MNDDFERKQPQNPSNESSSPPPRRNNAAQKFDESRKKKIESFQLNISDDLYADKAEEAPLAPQETPAFRAGAERPKQAPEKSISSYSENYTPQQKPQRSPVDKKKERELIKAEKKRKKQKSKKNGCLFKMIWGLLIVLVSVVLAQYIMVGVNDMLAIRREDKTVTVSIPKNATINEVTDILAENDVIERPDFFKLYAGITKNSAPFSKGTFELQTNMDYEAIINYLRTQSNRIDIVKVTFTEGMNVQDFAKQLEKSKVCSAKDFLEVCNSDEFDEDYPFLKNIKNKSERYYKLEGYLFPDTYEFYEDDKPERVARRLLSIYESRTTKKVRIEEGEPLIIIEEMAKEREMSMEEVMILASMIQAEAADEEDMFIVSSVFHNRLATEGKQNKFGEYDLYKLRSDATTFYPYKSKKTVPESIRDTFESRYDT